MFEFLPKFTWRGMVNSIVSAAKYLWSLAKGSVQFAHKRVKNSQIKFNNMLIGSGLIALLVYYVVGNAGLVGGGFALSIGMFQLWAAAFFLLYATLYIGFIYEYLKLQFIPVRVTAPSKRALLVF